MPKFFQTEIAGYGGSKNTFQNIKFKKNDFANSSAATAGTILEIIPVHIKNPPVIQFIAYLDNLSDTFNTATTQTQSACNTVLGLYFYSWGFLFCWI